MSSPHVVVIAQSSEAQSCYMNALKAYPLRITIVETFSKLYEELRNNATSAIMIDVITKMRAPSQDRELVQDILEVYPVLQLRFNINEKTFSALYYGQTTGESSLDAFIKNECMSTTPRTIRLDPRKELCFNILFSKSQVFSQESLGQGQTVNVSTSGCFLQTTQSAQIDEVVWIVFKELSDRTPIAAKIRRIVKWGEKMSPCGWGLTFEQIKSNQLEEFTIISC